MIRQRANSIKKDPGLITGDEKEYAQFTKTINQFKLKDLQNNERFLMDKLVKKQDYFRDRYEKKDFSTLSKVINTHFATFRNLLDENQALQNDFQQNEEFLSSKKEQIRKLAKQKADLLSQNERLKSRILTVHELNIAKHESQRTLVANIVVEEESVRYVGKAPSEKVQRLEEKEDKYVGYKESDLPVFRRVDELISFLGEEQQRQYDFPSNSSFSFQSFGEEIKPEQANIELIKKFLNPPQMSKEIHSSIEVENKEVSALKLGEVFQSRIRSTSMREPKMEPSKRFEEPESARRSETKMVKLDSNQLESKYVAEVNPMLNCEAEKLTKEQAFQKAQAKKFNQMRKEVFKNKFRNR